MHAFVCFVPFGELTFREFYLTTGFVQSFSLNPIASRALLVLNTTGGPDVVFDLGDDVMSMYENTLSIALIELVLKI